jgi:hypothetical protein
VAPASAHHSKPKPKDADGLGQAPGPRAPLRDLELGERGEIKRARRA